jgi:hypothetical protein
MVAGAVGVAHALGPTSSDSRDSAGAATAQRAGGLVADRAARTSVAPLRRLTPPDAVASLHARATAHQLRRLRHVEGVRAVAVVDTGEVKLHGRRLTVLGVAAAHLRGFTPALTAKSDELWQSVARGELTVGYAQSHGLRKSLGQDVALFGRHHRDQQLRLGAFASIGIGSAQALVPHASARPLGLHRAHRLIISAPHLETWAIATAVHRIFSNHAVVHSVRPHVVAQPISDFARSTIPATYLSLYRHAAVTCPGLPWTVLAGIGAVETGHGANVHRSTKGAIGPMQFLPSTFAAYAVDGDGDGMADIHNPSDAVYSAARYLCLWGAGRGGQALYDAIFAYNHADWYVREVVAYANAYL